MLARDWKEPKIWDFLFGLGSLMIRVRFYVEVLNTLKTRFVLGSSSVNIVFLFGSVRVLAVFLGECGFLHIFLLLLASGSVRLLAKPGFWFSSLLLGFRSFLLIILA